MNYQNYLDLNQLLSCQKPKSVGSKNPIHDEWLFIIIHQIYELWFKQILLDLESIIEIFYRGVLNEEQMALSLSRMERIITIEKVMIEQVGVIKRISFSDFLEFRKFLSSASALQSYQFRLLEKKLGLKDESRICLSETISKFSDFKENQKKALKEAESINLFYGVQKWLEEAVLIETKDFNFKDQYSHAFYEKLKKDKKNVHENTMLMEAEKERNLKAIDHLEKGFSEFIDKKSYDESRGKGLRRFSYEALLSVLMIQVYNQKYSFFVLPFRLITALINIDENLSLWRYHHALMVNRILGARFGTGGSSGASYLYATIEKHRVFSDFVQIASFFLPYSALPPLSKSIDSPRDVVSS